MTDPRPDQGLPDVRWGRSDTAAARAGERFVASRAGAAFIRTVVPLDRWVLRRSHGRRTMLGPFGAPLLLLTTTGSVSGRSRTTPLVYLLDGHDALVVGSNFGQAHHPAWSSNLLAQPDATVSIGGVEFAVRAELLSGDARAAGWSAFEAAAAPYRAYVERTSREIRVFRLTRTDES